MLLYGTFDERGCPWVDAIVALPRLRVRELAAFVVDTGADTTVLSRSDAIAIGVDLERLKEPYEAGGIGGTMMMHPERASVVLLDGSSEMSFDIEIGIPEENGDGSEELPSLLGRDIINQLSMLHDFPRRRLEFVVPLT